jgi:hypothetical protein
MSRLTSDRSQQQQPNQNQQIVQNIQQQHQQQQQQSSVQTIRSVQPQQQQPQFLTLAQGGPFLIINNPNDGSTLRTSANINSSNIYFPNSTTSSSATSSSAVLVASNSSASLNVTASSQLPTSTTHPTSPIAKKRLKLDITADSSSNCGSTTEDLAALRKRIYEHKLQRLKSLKDK